MPDRFQPPDHRSDVLPRRHLVEALAAHLDRKLQMVVAPAGFGKTSILAEFAHEAALPACWISLTPANGDLADFVRLLVTALGTHVPSFGQRALATLRGSPDIERSVGALVRSFITDIVEAIDAPVLLILDDFHEVNDNGPVVRFLGDLLRSLPDTLRIVLASRVMPALPLARLALENELYSLGVDDLRFTVEELEALLRLRGLDHVPANRVRELTAEVEGWIAGFLLTVSRPGALLAGGSFAPGTGADLLYDYLADEVLKRQSLDVQRFLLVTSVPEIADPALCRVLLGPGDWDQVVRIVATTGLFVSLVDDSGAFRYHQLFRDFLRARLRRLAPDDYRRLHVLVGEHLGARGEWQAALAHYRRVDAVAEHVQLVAQVVPELERQGRWRAVDAAVQGLSIDQLSHYPEVLLAAAWAAQRLEDFPRAVALAEAARAIGVHRDDAGLAARALARLGMIANVQGRMQEAIHRLEQARSLAPDDGELVASVQFYLGQVLGKIGDLNGAMAQLRSALAYFDESGPPRQAADAETALANALSLSGRLAEGAARFQSASERWRRLGIVDAEIYTLSLLGDLNIRRGEYGLAQIHLNEALQRARTGGGMQSEADALGRLGRLWLVFGEPHAAVEAFRQGLDIAQEFDDPGQQVMMLEGLGLAFALQGDLGQAEAHAYQAIALAQRAEQRLLEQVCALTLGAIQSRMGHANALVVLRRAAETLTTMQARWQMARAQAWLAHAHFRLGVESAAMDHLQIALRIAETNGSDAVFDLHVRWDAALFEAALAAGIEPERLQTLLARTAETSGTRVSTDVEQQRLVEVYGFGTGAAAVEGPKLAVWRREKSRELFFLLLNRGAQRYDQLIEALWPDSPPARAHARLHTAVSHLRQAVHERIVVRAAGMYRINEQVLARYDVAEFERLLRQATGASAEEAIVALRQAVDLYTAPFLSETSAEWCDLERDRLERLYLAALTRLADLHAAAGQHHETIAVAERLLRTDPYREDAHARIIRAHLRLGNRAAALRHFKQCTRLLRDELGVSPGPELMALLRRGDG